ncbi:MAG: hypothetical protein OHK0039_08810 [Bacteroidia bacterium]
MNKLAAILFSVWYLLATAGISVNVHYCLGRVASVKVYVAAQPCCCGYEETMHGCCSDTYLYMQVDQEQQSGEAYRPLPVVAGLAAPVAAPAPVMVQQVSGPKVPDMGAPPPQPVPHWLLNCSLVYYG